MAEINQSTHSFPNIELYNTLSHQKEHFKTVVPGKVGMYLCGPTVYKPSHIGHMVGPVIFDTIKRHLVYSGWDVTWVVNITDVDDKLITESKNRGMSMAALAEEMTTDYLDNLSALGVDGIDTMPKATDHIEGIIQFIAGLVEKDFAYPADGDVYFDVAKDKDYGKLTNRTLEKMQGEGGATADRKRSAADFALWKKAKSGEPSWESPWGPGRPGWHIECSAMVKKHLGDTIDIHGGGSDLTFPHHENEAAQSRCANSDPGYVRYWLHNGMLNLGTEKMSKSLGNVLTIRALLEQHSSEVLRYALLSGQYRSSLTWSDELLVQARASLDSLYQSLRDADDASSVTSLDRQGLALEDYPSAVVAALCDDLNTPKALAAMHELANQVRRAPDGDAKKHAVNQLLAGGWLLGLLVHTPESYFTQGQPGAKDSLSADAIEQLLEQRKAARASGDYAGADRIRDDLLAEGIELEDSREGTRWRKL